MANLAKIQSIAEGQFFVKDSLGNLTELKVGDTVSLNDTIVAASSNTDLSKIEILFDTNELITLSQGEQLLDATLLASTFGNEELAFDKQEVDETLNAWNNTEASDATDMETAAGDVTEQATNAGDERAADGGALRSKFNSRDGASTNVESDLREASFGGGNTEEPQEQIPTDLLNPIPTAPLDTRVPASTITLSDETVNEGADIIITATVTNPPQTDLIITLNNGQTITIPAGQTAGSSKPFTNPNSEDVYIDKSTVTYKITDTTGGNYVSLDTSDSSVVTIEDTEDTTTVKITGTDTTEGGKATFELELSNKPQTGTTATGKVEVDGKSYDVTFDADGKATLTVDVKANDVYNGEPTLTAKVTEISGGNFEKVNPNAQTTITVKDTEDTTTVKITGTDTTEGGKATFEL
ncbi:immunoglobulin-like domain-containing protein, partial [Aliarcobacter cryaerophilus]|uniref:immunoglobulin-like domain-containing protein n=1 Tax=Aliarcobacter cryaerophilus TaxID=28198 RepID=UPI00317193EB